MARGYCLRSWMKYPTLHLIGYMLPYLDHLIYFKAFAISISKRWPNVQICSPIGFMVALVPASSPKPSAISGYRISEELLSWLQRSNAVTRSIDVVQIILRHQTKSIGSCCFTTESSLYKHFSARINWLPKNRFCTWNHDHHWQIRICEPKYWA